MIFHLVEAARWAGAPYRAPSLEREGFIHCTRGVGLLHRVARSAFGEYRGELLLLYVDEGRLGAPCRDEGEAGGPLFPHVYGPIEGEAILAVRRMPLVAGLGRVFPGLATEWALADDRRADPIAADLFGEALLEFPHDIAAPSIPHDIAALRAACAFPPNGGRPGRLVPSPQRGKALEAAAGAEGRYDVRREDGYLDRSPSGRDYCAPPGAHFPFEVEGLAALAGRVLDVGAGAGRAALFLEERGCEVTAIDTSPGAIEVMRRRGVRTPVLADIFTFEAAAASFDGAVLLGFNAGLGGTPDGLDALFGRLAGFIRPSGALFYTQIEVGMTDRPEHLGFHAANRAIGREPGEMWIRIERAGRRGPWFPWYVVGSAESAAAAERAGFAVERTFRAAEGPAYGVLARRR